MLAEITEPFPIAVEFEKLFELRCDILFPIYTLLKEVVLLIPEKCPIIMLLSAAVTELPIQIILEPMAEPPKLIVLFGRVTYVILFTFIWSYVWVAVKVDGV